MIEMHIVANLVTLGVIGALAYIGWSNGLFFLFCFCCEW